MKNIRYIFLFLAAVLATACADEGPEIVGKFDVTGTVYNITPYTANLRIVNGNGSANLMGVIYDVYVEGVNGEWASCSELGAFEGLDGKTYEYQVKYLKPETTYRVLVRGCQDADGNDNPIEIYVSEMTFTTPSTDDISGFGEFIMSTEALEDHMAAFSILLPAGLTLGENSTMYISKTPDYKNDSEHIEISFNWNGYYGTEEEGLRAWVEKSHDYDADRFSINAFLCGLDASTTYYVAVQGNFIVPGDYGSILGEVFKLVVPENNSFTTKSKGWVADQLGLTVSLPLISSDAATFKLQFANQDNPCYRSISKYGVEIRDIDGKVGNSNLLFDINEAALISDLTPSTEYSYSIYLFRDAYIFSFNTNFLSYIEVKNPVFKTLSADEPFTSLGDTKVTGMELEANRAEFYVELPWGLSIGSSYNIGLELFDSPDMSTPVQSLTGSYDTSYYYSYVYVMETSSPVKLHVVLRDLTPGKKYFMRLKGDFYYSGGSYNQINLLLQPDINTFTTPAQ